MTTTTKIPQCIPLRQPPPNMTNPDNENLPPTEHIQYNLPFTQPLPKLQKTNTNSPLKLFDIAKKDGRPLYTSAPMVRYSKLAFRETVRAYGVDLCWTPMILAKEFNRSAMARDSDFTTSPTDTPLIVQFGANDPLELSRATTLVAPFVSGVDLNCGCPQSWACAECLGAALMNKPDLISTLIRSMKSALSTVPSGSQKSVSAKIRIHPNLHQTTDLITLLERSGCDFITIHGRQKSTPSSHPVNLEAIKILKSHASVPIIANGDVYDLDDVEIYKDIGVDGVMSARGILENPGMFREGGREGCSWDVVDRFLNALVRAPLPFKLVLHHVSEMTGNSPDTGGVARVLGRAEGKGRRRKALLTKRERGEMMGCRNIIELIDWLDLKREEKFPADGEEDRGIRRDWNGYLKAWR